VKLVNSGRLPSGPTALLWQLVEHTQSPRFGDGELGLSILHTVELAVEQLVVGISGFVGGQCQTQGVEEDGCRCVGCHVVQPGELGVVGRLDQPGNDRLHTGVGHFRGIQQGAARLIAQRIAAAIPEEATVRSTIQVHLESLVAGQIGQAWAAAGALLVQTRSAERQERAGGIRVGGRLGVATGTGEVASG
jgi:hypothetical protein